MDNSSPARDTALNVVGLTVDSTLGAVFLGFTSATILYGITCCQTLNYYRSRKSKDDNLAVKCLIAAVWLLDSLHQCISTHIVYWYVIMNYGNAASLLNINWSAPGAMIINCTLCFIVQGFYINRIWRFGHNVWISGLCAIMSIATLGAGLVFPLECFRYPEAIFMELKLKPMQTASLALALATDVVLTAVLVGYLYTSRTGFRRTDAMLTRLIILSIGAGSLTICALLASLIGYVIAPTKLWDILFAQMLSKLYANSLLIVLNFRESVANKSPIGNFTFQSIQFAGLPANTSTPCLSGKKVRGTRDLAELRGVNMAEAVKRTTGNASHA